MRTSLLKPAAAVGLAAVTILGTASMAAAAPPQREVITFSQTFEDEFLTAACGVPVTTTESGRITFMIHPDRPVGPQEIVAVRLSFEATAGGNTVRFVDVGADLIRVEPDGTVVLMIIGQLPFWFTGVMKIDLDTGEVILEPQHSLDTTKVCAALTG